MNYYTNIYYIVFIILYYIFLSSFQKRHDSSYYEYIAFIYSLYLFKFFWNLTLKHQNHKPNLQNHTLILCLWPFL